jgi:poly(hydroxyalkanoate) granule-associated protein
MSKELRTQDAVPRLRAAAHEIWLAGLGALAMAEDEGEKTFKMLVKRGKEFEGIARERLDDVREKLDVRKGANTMLTRLGTNVDNGVTEVVHRLGLPTKKEIDGLAHRVDRLTKTIETRAAAPRSRVRATRLGKNGKSTATAR